MQTAQGLTGLGPTLRRRIILTVLLGAAILVFVWGAARAQTIDWLLSPVDARAEIYLETTLTKTAVTYAAARGVHAVVSILQGTQVHPPFLTVAAGEVLDPLRDLVERFSVLMLLATASVGAQRILMELGQWIGLGVIGAAGLALLMASLWVERYRAALFRWGWRLAVAGLAFRLLIPLAAFAASQVSAELLESRYGGAMTQLGMGQDAFESGVGLSPEGENSWLDRAKGWIDADRLSKRLEGVAKEAETMVASLLTLFTLFVFETLLFPLATLWALLRLFRITLPVG